MSLPHCVIVDTPSADKLRDILALCPTFTDAMLTVRDEVGKQVFPTGGTSVLAYPAAHYAVADRQADYSFVDINLSMDSGRSESVHELAGDMLLAASRNHFARIFERLPIGITLQIDESPGQVHDGKHSSLHPRFQN